MLTPGSDGQGLRLCSWLLGVIFLSAQCPTHGETTLAAGGTGVRQLVQSGVADAAAADCDLHRCKGQRVFDQLESRSGVAEVVH